MAEILFKQVARMDGTNDFDLVPYSDEEIKQRDKDIAAFAQAQADQDKAEQLQATKKAAILTKLGITEDELKIALS